MASKMESELLLQKWGMGEKMNQHHNAFQLFARGIRLEFIWRFLRSYHAIYSFFMVFSLSSCALIKQEDSIKSHEICEIHGCKMEYTILVLDEYAGREMPESFYAARGGIFPYTGTAFPVCTFYPNRDMTWRCPDCARAGRIWCNENLKKQPFL